MAFIFWRLFQPELMLVKVALGACHEHARVVRRVTEPYAQSIHGGQGGTRGEVLPENREAKGRFSREYIWVTERQEAEFSREYPVL